MSIVENCVYQAGRRVADPASLSETYKLLGAETQIAWIGLYEPAAEELCSLANEFGLHELAVEDALKAHQRPKIERYGDTLFVALRSARYIDEKDEIVFGELHIFVGAHFLITVRHGQTPNLPRVRARMEKSPDLLGRGTEAILYAVLDQVVDEYFPVVAGLENDILEIEGQVFAGEPGVSQRIYWLSRQVVEFHRAVGPVEAIVSALTEGFQKYQIDAELQRYLRNVLDHLMRILERLDGLRQLLQAALAVNATLVSQEQNAEMKKLTEASLAQNEEVKRISAWAAILFAPTVVGTIYGMNFAHMPELSWAFGYPVALCIMAVVCTALYLTFKRRNWL